MSSRGAELCLLCRGAKGLCGKRSCPVLALWRAVESVKPPSSPELEELSPPSVFVGRVGYPKVRVAPAVTTGGGSAELYEKPELWLEMPLEEVLRMRLSLVRGVVQADVRKPRILEEITLAAMSSKPVELDIRFEKPPKPRVHLDLFSPPFGPAGVAEKVRVLSNPAVPKPLERVHGDESLKAEEAVVYLYENGVPVSQIQRAFSVGALGSARLRRLVPTRWSITAVDDILSRHLLRQVRRFEQLDSYLFFERRFADNTFVAILAPGSWSYEWIEAWFPHTTWNPGIEVSVEGDWEGFRGRDSYASLGGCYYAARLATAEYLVKVRRQATAILLREIYEGFFLPIGVWFVRENIRELFRSQPERYSSLREVLERLSRSTRLPLSTWLKASRLLRDMLLQRKLEVG
ncbi:MAG: Nre family DNA repair protein [Thermofilum sp.]